MEPQLSHYTQFYIVLTNMVKTETITTDQKQLLKGQLIKKDKDLCSLLLERCGPGRELDLRDALLAHLQNNVIQPRRRNGKSRTVHFDKPQPQQEITLEMPQIVETQTSFDDISPVRDKMTENLVALLGQHQKKNGILSLQDKAKLLYLRNTLNEIVDENIEIDKTQMRARNSSTVSRYRDDFSEKSNKSEETGIDLHKKIISQVKAVYKNLKKIFTGNLHTHLLLMQDDLSYNSLFSVLKFMVKILVDADEFTFFIRREQEWEVFNQHNLEMYQTENDSINQVTKEQVYLMSSEINFIKPFFIYKTGSQQFYPVLEDLARVKTYKVNSFVKFGIPHNNSEVLFFYHWREKDKHNLERKFINHANEYGFTNEVTELSQFLVETIIQARVQFFNPLNIADRIQDLGINFVRISRYLLVEGIKKALEMHYIVEKDQNFSHQNGSRVPGDRSVRMEIRDSHPISLIIKNMDLSNPYEQDIYQDIICIQERYASYVKLCHEKSAFYKYFLRTIDSLLFDFNKKGELIFLSRPITQEIKYKTQFKVRERYDVFFDPKAIICKKAHYTEIFTSETMRKHIESNIHQRNTKNQYLQNTENPQFEIFLKVVEDSFKGFAVIFHENQTRRLRHHLKSLKTELSEIQDKTLEQDIKLQIRKSYFKHQTFKFLNQLEISNPNIKNSMISMFIPENDRELNLQKTANLRRLSNKSDRARISPLKTSPSFQQYPIEDEEDSPIRRTKTYVRLTVFDITFLEDPLIDQPNFNIFTYDNIIKKQCIVYTILMKCNFIDSFSIPIHQMMQFMMELERKYNKRQNPFHNYDHGVSVMQSAYVLCNAKKAQDLLSELVKFSTIISGLCHDIGHTARANLFEINSHSKLATRYHDKSPLEQHHAASTMKILQRPESNILQNLSTDDFNTFKKVLIQNILYTDIKEHFNLLKDFENRVKESKEVKEKAFGVTDDDLKLFTGMIVHTADFNGGAKVFEVSREWSERVNKEFIAQFDEEGQRGIPQTPFLKDLQHLHVMAKSEMGFFKVIVRPLWASLNDFYEGELDTSVKNLDNTIISWEKVYHANLPS